MTFGLSAVDLPVALCSLLLFVAAGDRVDIETSPDGTDEEDSSEWQNHGYLHEETGLDLHFEEEHKSKHAPDISEKDSFSRPGLPDLASESRRVKPLLWVPGLASTNLDFRLTEDWKEKVLGSDQPKLPHVCSKIPGLAGARRMGLYINIPILMNVGCWIHSMKLTYGEGPRGSLGADGSGSCGRDNPGVEVFPKSGFAATNAVGGVTVAGDLFRALLKVGYDDKSLQVMENDWRRWSLPCYNIDLFAKFKARVESMYADHGNSRVIVAAHSMGAPIVVRFLSAMHDDWKRKHIRHFVSIAGPLAGAPIFLHYFFDGPRELLGNITIQEGSEDALRTTLNSWAGLLSLFPSTYGGAYSDGEVLVTVGAKKYTINSFIDGSFFKDAVASTIAWGLGSGTLDRTSKGCVCTTGCNFDELPSPIGGFGPWCFTNEDCGRESVRGGRWDYCTIPNTTFNPDGDEAIHKHVSSWLRSYHEPFVKAPNVPTTCYTVNNKDTRSAWKYPYEGSANGTFTRVVPGDGIVPAVSSTKPCMAWVAAQKEPVNIVEMPLGAHEDWRSNAHKGMLSDRQWLKWFFQLLSDV